MILRNILRTDIYVLRYKLVYGMNSKMNRETFNEKRYKMLYISICEIDLWNKFWIDMISALQKVF